jgi:hypothetical protein
MRAMREGLWVLQALGIPLVAVRQGWTDAAIPYAIHYLTSFGPALAALVVTTLTAGRSGLGELWGRITRWRVKWAYAAFAVLSPVALFVLAAVAMRVIQGDWPDLHLLRQANYLPKHTL